MVKARGLDLSLDLEELSHGGACLEESKVMLFFGEDGLRV